MRKAIAILVALCTMSLVGAGCSWVKTTPAGAGIVEASAADVGGCQELGTASGTTRTSVGLPRNKDVIRDEQVTLARNQAALIGGDTIVQAGPPQGGMLSFTVYRCH